MPESTGSFVWKVLYTRLCVAVRPLRIYTPKKFATPMPKVVSARPVTF